MAVRFEAQSLFSHKVSSVQIQGAALTVDRRSPHAAACDPAVMRIACHRACMKDTRQALLTS
ncbi:hypothetical protein AU467_29610 [Mesorhizobium loti]|uniref:Uncharacterized protein n=1 Tax=Rhizobium loti TaxID=381 RepID=A0A101KPK9_RHILI|nr:hypothetical protein AU467_29610 [Mesorhizobium loti]